MYREFASAVPEERSGPSAEGTFLAISAILFLASAAGTCLWCGSGSCCGGTPMPGGWSLSTAWLGRPGQTWLAAGAEFLGMWAVMMAAMMLPSLVPMLLSYRRSLRRMGETRLGLPALAAGSGYFVVWTLFGAAAYPLGAAVAVAEMRWEPLARAVPLATGVVLVLAGLFQLTPWKARHLGCCRSEPSCGRPPREDEPRALRNLLRRAFRHGLRLGAHCSLCCFGFMMVLLAIGAMDLIAMAVVTAAITAERISPRPVSVARATGVVVIVAGAYLIARAAGAA